MASDNKNLYRRIRTVTVLGVLLIALLLLLQKETKPLSEVDVETPAGITHIRSIYGVKAGDNFDKPESVGIDKDGNLYVADTGNHRIAVFDKSGEYIRHFGDRKSVPYPLSIAISKSGRMYVTSLMMQRLTILDKNGKVKKKMQFKKKDEIPLRVTLYKGKMYMTTVGKIMIGDMDGNIEKRLSKEGRALGMLEYPNGIAVTKVGKLKEAIVISDSNNNIIQVFRMNGQPYAYLGRPPKSLKDKGLLFGLPTGLTIDQEGRVFVMDSLNHTVRIFNNAGDDLGELGKQGSSDGFFFYPTDIQHMGGKRFVITDKWNDRAQIVDLTLSETKKVKTPPKKKKFIWWNPLSWGNYGN